MFENCCCFTGHRILPEKDVPEIKKKLTEEIINAIEIEKIQYFLCGGALGFDLMCAETVLDLKKQYPSISLCLILPCPNHNRFWRKQDKERFSAVLSSSDEEFYTSDSYFQGCMQKRNRCLVDYSKLCICYLTRQAGGTAYTVQYAEKRGISCRNLAPTLNSRPI